MNNVDAQLNIQSAWIFRGRSFDSRLGLTKDFENGSNGCPPWRSGLWGKAITADWLMSGLIQAIPVTNTQRKRQHITETLLRKTPNIQSWTFIRKFTNIKTKACLKLVHVGTHTMSSSHIKTTNVMRFFNACKQCWNEHNHIEYMFNPEAAFGEEVQSKGALSV